MFTFQKLQEELQKWQNHNFPGRKWNKPYMGMVEELGELSHGLLKQEQNIRGSYEEHEEKIKDSVADLIVFAADFCNARGYNLEKLMEETWNSVKTRDWVKYPKNGRNE